MNNGGANGSATSATFADFWALFPRRVAKKDAERAWNRLDLNLRALAMTALPNHIKFWEADGRARTFIPHPATWLNGARWEDEIEAEEVIPQKAVAWWATDDGVLKKGRELGVHAKGGESMAQYKVRVVEAARKAA